jgi:E3 ubiquitin-protein ligase HUWE1
MGILGRSRSIAGSADATTHPLLLEATGGSGRHIPDLGRAVRRSQRILAAGGHQDLLQAIEDIIGGGAVQLFQHIVNPRGGASDTIRLDVPPGTLVNLDRGLLPRRTGVSASLRIDQPSRSVPLRSESRDFDPLPTMQRWSEEAKILHGKFGPDRFGKLGNHVILALLPAAIEKARVSKEAKEAAEREETQRKEAEAQAEEAEAAKKAAEAEAASQIPTPAPPSPSAVETASDSVVSAPDPPITSEVDTEMLDATAESRSESEQDAIDDDTGAPDTIAPPEGSGEPGPANMPERITVIIHGSPVDITDTGIDPTFLEALPDDMREEVVNQHIRDQQAARLERPPDSQISAEFLDALPPEIRAEILHQERIEQARRRAEEGPTATSTGGAAPAPVDMDPASFIASLDPQLRQDVLMEQDEGFIQTLPSHIIAEAGTYRERAPRQPPRASAGSQTEGTNAAAIARKPQAPRDAIQLLDKSGVAVLVRLLFFPQISRKNILYKTLVNLCENSRTRSELFNFLLNILQEGTGDLAAIDRSFTQMTIKNSKGPAQALRLAGKQKTGPEYLSSLPAHHSPSEVVPDLIAQRCLEALSYIVTSNESSSLFFLTEQEMAVGLRRHSSKKGKGKEKQAAQTQYPIVLLLSLLDRQPLLKTPSVLELVVSLLDTVTRPLAGLKVSQKPEGPAISTAPPTQQPEEASSDPRASLAEQNAPAPAPSKLCPYMAGASY